MNDTQQLRILIVVAQPENTVSIEAKKRKLPRGRSGIYLGLVDGSKLQITRMKLEVDSVMVDLIARSALQDCSM